jgi:small GTP-binding protein
MSIFDQTQDVILQWFEEQKLGNAKPLNEVKVVFLGDGEAGKTHTITRLLKNGEILDPADFDGKATPGIVIRDKEYEIDGKKIQVHFWDFGGQEILHSMHRMFLTERTLYVVIINARDDTQNDRARYWLHNIKSFAGTAPVLLVLNKIDQNPNASINMSDLQGMYGGLKQVISMSALEYTTEKFNEIFTAALMEQVKALGTLGTMWPASWLKLKRGLETMQTHYIHGCEYEDLCEESGVEQSREDLLHWFNDLGVSFCYSGSSKLEDYVILKPEWLTNAIYIVLFNKCEEAQNGIIPLESINQMLKKPRKDQNDIKRVLKDVFYNPQEVDYVMDVIRKFRLSYKVREDAEFIPVLCQRESMPVAAEYAADPDALEFTMTYEYLPDNVIHRLMVEMRQDLDTANVWRTGARFAQVGTDFSAVVKSEGNLLRIFVRSGNPMHRPNTYLHIIPWSFQSHYTSLPE